MFFQGQPTSELATSSVPPPPPWPPCFQHRKDTECVLLSLDTRVNILMEQSEITD